MAGARNRLKTSGFSRDLLAAVRRTRSRTKIIRTRKAMCMGNLSITRTSGNCNCNRIRPRPTKRMGMVDILCRSGHTMRVRAVSLYRDGMCVRIHRMRVGTPGIYRDGVCVRIHRMRVGTLRIRSRCGGSRGTAVIVVAPRIHGNSCRDGVRVRAASPRRRQRIGRPSTHRKPIDHIWQRKRG